jgi:hypothetical protein
VRITYFHAGFLLGLFFDSEVGGEIFLRIVVNFQLTTQIYIAESRTLQRICRVRKVFFVSCHSQVVYHVWSTTDASPYRRSGQ